MFCQHLLIKQMSVVQVDDTSGLHFANQFEDVFIPFNREKVSDNLANDEQETRKVEIILRNNKIFTNIVSALWVEVSYEYLSENTHC